MQHISAAFSSVPAPEWIICHECDECLRLDEALRGRTADQLSESWIEENFDKLPLFSDEAKQFFLPAYLRVGALKPDSVVSQFVLYALSTDFRMQPSGGYSELQQQAIHDYLSFIESRLSESDQEDFAKAVALWNPVT